MEQERTIGNVNVLDLRSATEASIAGITQIRNANVVVYSRESTALLSRINIGNANAMVEIPSEVKVETVTGQAVIKGDYFKDQEERLFLLGVGQVIIGPDVPAEEITRGLAGLVVVGQLVCPENLAGIVQSKTLSVTGQTKTYPPFDDVTLGSLVLDERALAAMDDGSQLAVIGSLRIPQVVPNDLISRKLREVYVSGSVLCYEENAAAIRKLLTDPSTKVVVIPSGFKLVDRPLDLDRSLLESIPPSKLYCRERVVVRNDVDPSLVDEKLEELSCEELVIAPRGLKEVLSRKCDLLQTDFVFYDGDLLLYEGEGVLRRSRFDHLAKKATLFVEGELTIDPEVTGDLLIDRIAKVHNRGIIRCPPDQLGAIEALLGISDGELVDVTEKKKEYWIANTNYLTL